MPPSRARAAAPPIAPEVELALGADVEELMRNATAAARPGEASGVAETSVVVSAPLADERRVEEPAVGRERVVAGDEQHDRR